MFLLSFVCPYKEDGLDLGCLEEVLEASFRNKNHPDTVTGEWLVMAQDKMTEVYGSKVILIASEKNLAQCAQDGGHSLLDGWLLSGQTPVDGMNRSIVYK